MKKAISLLLTIVLMLSLVGCGGATKTNKNNEPVNDSNAETNSDKDTEKDKRAMEGNMYLEGFPIVKEPITIKIAAIDWWNSENYETLQTPKEYEKLTNIHCEWQHITSPEQLNLIFAGGDSFPDLFLFLDYDKINELGKDGQLLPVQDLIKKYAPNVQKMFEKEPIAEKLCTASDGNMYIIPSMYMSPGEMLRGSTYINRKWLNKLNLDMPTNMDEFYSVLKAFKDEDPNGNGKEDEIPLSLLWDNDLYGICSLFGPWGITSSAFGPFYAKDQKEIVASVMQPEYKDAIKYFHKLYKEGLLDQEAFTQDHDKYLSKISPVVERETIIVGASNGYTPINPGNKEIKDMDYVMVEPLEGPKGKHHFVPVGAGIFTNNYMSADTKYAKEIMRWIDGIAESETSFMWNGGPEGILWKKNSEGKIERIEGTDKKNCDYSFILPIMGVYSEWYNNNVVLSKDDKVKLEILEAVRPVGDQYVLDSKRAGNIPLVFSKEEEDFISTYYTDISQFCKNKEAEWIMQGGIDKQWDDYQNQLKKMKIEELMDIYQKALDEWVKK
ncbi:MAG: extracellular solute-binding protein [Vallitalea sp.]|jgi:putative aldouronate transport system substrate-binding protein|nr:extracellular solute-binding protein [Vallitalea sp.]